MKVLFLDRVHPCLQDELEAMGFECDLQYDLLPEQVSEHVGDYTGIVIRSKIKLDRQILDKAKNLQFIARSGSGLESIDWKYAEEKGIRCFNAPEGNRDAVAEHALGMLLALFNNLVKADREVRAQTWNRESNRGIELGGRTVGIIGFGNTGRAFANKLSGLGANIMAYDKYLSGFGNDHVQEVSLQELQEQSNVISFHVPLTEETAYYLDDKFINAVSNPFHVINTSRGQVVNTKQLVEGLESGKIPGACLDVLEYENISFEDINRQLLPVEFEYLMNSDKVLLSPHVAGWTVESYRKLSQILADKIRAAFAPGATQDPS